MVTPSNFRNQFLLTILNRRIMLNQLNEIGTTFQNASLEEAIQKLQELKERRRDFVIPVQNMRMNYAGEIEVSGVMAKENSELAGLGVTMTPEVLKLNSNEVANRHIAGRFNIPYKYWDKCLSELPCVAMYNLNGWIAKEVEDKGNDKARRMLVRTYMNEAGGTEGTLRALLSDKYLMYDNLNVLAVALKAVKEANDNHGLNIQVDKCDLSEKKMYVRFVCPSIEQEAPDALQNYVDPNNGENGGLGISNGIVTGFVLSNSEVGMGSLSISPRVTVLACRNGMIWKEEGFRRMHLGAKMSEGEMIWKDDTKAANIVVVEKQLRDMIEKYVNPEFLGERVADIEDMAARKLENPVECCKNMCQAIGMSEGEMDGIFEQFVKQRDTSSVFSVAQAITGHAHYVNPERREELEVAATGLMNLVDKCDVAKVIKVAKKKRAVTI